MLQAAKLLELETKTPGSRRGLQDLVFSMLGLRLVLVQYFLILSPLLLLAVGMDFLSCAFYNYVICIIESHS